MDGAFDGDVELDFDAGFLLEFGGEFEEEGGGVDEWLSSFSESI